MSTKLQFWALWALLLLLHYAFAICLNEKHRPQFHVSPVANWSNDPNGMVYYAGEYHLYFQHHPYSTQWGPMHWGHTKSPDMVHWSEQPIAIYPDPVLGTIFSGSAVVDHHNASGFATALEPAPIVAIYTHAGDLQQQSVSYSNDRGMTYTSYAGNPVIPNTDRLPDFRDPKVIEYTPGQWSMVVAAGPEVIFYETRNLLDWTETGRFGNSPPEGAHCGPWECPDLLRFTYEDQTYWVLVVSQGCGALSGGSGTQYFIGDFDGRNFKSFMQERVQWVGYGPDNYAGVTFSNELLQRNIYMAWMSNLAYSNDLPTGEGGWRGQFTIPRVLDMVFVDGRLRLRSSPVPELASLRNATQVVQLPLPITFVPDVPFPLFDIVPFRNPLLEVDLTFNLAGLDPAAAFWLCFYNGFGQDFCVSYERTGNRVVLNRDCSGNIDFNGNFMTRVAADRQTSSSTLTLKLYVDVSSVEVFVDGGLSTLTAVFYPDEPFLEANITLYSPESGSRLVLEGGTVQGLNSIYDC